MLSNVSKLVIIVEGAPKLVVLSTGLLGWLLATKKTPTIFHLIYLVIFLSLTIVLNLHRPNRTRLNNQFPQKSNFKLTSPMNTHLLNWLYYCHLCYLLSKIIQIYDRIFQHAHLSLQLHFTIRGFRQWLDRDKPVIKSSHHVRSRSKQIK